MIPHRPSKCVVCGCALTVHQAVQSLCGDPDCRGIAIKNAAAKKVEEQQAAMHEVAVQWLNGIHEASESSRQYELLVLPGRDSTLEETPRKQREALHAHLQALVKEARVAATSEDALAIDLAPRPGLASACAACRGYCCRGGGSRAFIDAHTIARVRSVQPKLDDDGIVATYVGAIPKRHVVDSCVFHGAQGCALSRDLRSQTCNEFYCQPLRTWIVSAPQMQPKPTAVAVVQDGRVVRSALIDNVDGAVT